MIDLWYNKHIIKQDRFNNILYILSFNFFYKSDKFSEIRNRFKKEEEAREKSTSDIKDIKTEQIILYDIVAIEDRYKLFERIKNKLFERIKNKQSKKDIYTFRLKDIEKWFRDMTHKSLWVRYKIDVNKDIYTTIMKYHEEYLIVSLTINLQWDKKDIIKNSVSEYIKTPYYWLFERKNLFSYINKWISLPWESKIDEVWKRIENSIIWYINQYQQVLWGIFYQEKTYPPIELVLSIYGFNYREHQDLLILWKNYDLLLSSFCYNDTLERWYILGTKESDSTWNNYIQYLSNLINKKVDLKEWYSDIIYQVLSEKQDESLNINYLFITNYFLSFLQDKINLIYSGVISLQKNKGINLKNAIKLKNLLSWYIVLFQRIEKDEFTLGQWIKLQKKLSNSAEQKKKDIKLKVKLINNFIKTNLEYKIIQTNNIIQRISIIVAILSLIVACIALRSNNEVLLLQLLFI